MSVDILIHKNSYTKIQSALTYGFIKCGDQYSFKIMNCHNNIYDIYYLTKPKNILLQIEEYTNEFHTFIHDNSIDLNKIFLSISIGQHNYDTYIKILSQIKNNKVFAVAPKCFIEYAEKNKISNANFIQYYNLYNRYIFFPEQNTRNNKILCILSTDKNCIELLDPYLYPKTNLPIVMINNPEIKNDQNIGLLFDNDLNKALNTYGSVIDMTQSYNAEISVCGIPMYSIDDLSNLSSAVPRIINESVEETEDFIKFKLMA